MIDACVLATISALRNGIIILILLIAMMSSLLFLVRLPAVKTDSGKPLVSMATKKPLKTGSIPVMTSFAIHKK